MFKLNFEKINFEKLGKLTLFLMRGNFIIKSLLIVAILYSILAMPMLLLDEETKQKYLCFFIIAIVVGGNSLTFFYIRGFKSKRDKAEMIIADNIITINVLGRKVLSTSFSNINIKFFHIFYGRYYGTNIRPALLIKFDDYAQNNLMIEIDLSMKNSLEWKNNFKTKRGTYHSTAVKINKDKFIELAEALNIINNLEILP
ncbi:MAG: hypothetical protein K8R54_04050 [Bacteroidales bacterium]|nr:hypothetical protein [Bacteroidales bacterium]